MSEAERKRMEEFWKQGREEEKAEEEKRIQGLEKAVLKARRMALNTVSNFRS